MEVLKDKDCTINTPVVLGVQDSPIYGKGISIKPRVDGRKDSKHFESIYLPELLPLEEYDLIVVLISGGKDSIACFYKLLELGVPKEKIELWHHDIDGGHPSRRMDWKCTQNYMKALADAEGVKLRVSYRVNGFFGELYRIGASEPIEWIDPDTDEVKQCKLSSNYLKCQEIKEQCLEEMEDLLKEYGCRMKFPAKSPDLSRRWCSAYLKVMVADSVVSNLDRLEELGGKRHKFPAKGGTHQGRWCSGNLKAAVQDSVTANLEETKQDKKILIVSGERRGESAGRSKYNEIEIHRTNAEKRNHRIVHQWRCCIDYTEKDVWEVLKRHHVNPHPCYRLGWNRCSYDALVGAATLNKAIQKAGGDNKNIFKLVIMHSEVATNLENMKLLKYMTYTDADGIERELALATWNGRTVLVDDNMPTEDVAKAGDVEAYTAYTTYVLGEGAIILDDIGDAVPYEMSRDPKTNGGQDTL